MKQGLDWCFFDALCSVVGHDSSHLVRFFSRMTFTSSSTRLNDSGQFVLTIRRSERNLMIRVKKLQNHSSSPWDTPKIASLSAPSVRKKHFNKVTGHHPLNRCCINIRSQLSCWIYTAKHQDLSSGETQTDCLCIETGCKDVGLQQTRVLWVVQIYQTQLQRICSKTHQTNTASEWCSPIFISFPLWLRNLDVWFEPFSDVLNQAWIWWVLFRTLHSALTRLGTGTGRTLVWALLRLHSSFFFQVCQSICPSVCPSILTFCCHFFILLFVFVFWFEFFLYLF